jgi:hypothetical protein
MVSEERGLTSSGVSKDCSAFLFQGLRGPCTLSFRGRCYLLLEGRRRRDQRMLLQYVQTSFTEFHPKRAIKVNASGLA